MTDPSTGPLRTGAYIDGRFRPAADGATFTSRSPATGRPIAEVTACGPVDVDAAVSSARTAFDSGVWSEAEPAERQQVLLRLADLIEAATTELAGLESLDAGRPLADCHEFDLPDTIGTIRWYAEAIDKVFGKIAPTGPGALGLIVREPIGVVGAVLPWNFPAAMLAWKMAPALAAGNSLVVKPPELASLSTLRIAELATEAGIPDGVFNVAPGLGHIAGKALGLHPDVDMITFTGSTEVGRQFLRYAADSNLKNITLECGGKSPQIVLADNADRLPQVAADLAEAAFWASGQNCSAGSRILVHESLRADFVAELARQAEQRIVGDPAEPETILGPLIEAEALARVLRFIDEAQAAGARIVTGGRALFEDSGGWFIAPTVIDQVTAAMPIARQEVFGPVVAVIGFHDEDEALALANDTTYGLSATIWSHDIDRVIRLARGVRAGTVAINGYSEGNITTPFGGYRSSGFGGRDNGLEALEQYTQLKTIWLTVRSP
ncbi:aldehyde dehydrogenase [Arthrobacter rhombi]|uniref:aldehyde dehydrogenase n=1 Tax=Arthrobacter rhombi TaxID=71253 RepID=UPI003FD2FB63